MTYARDAADPSVAHVTLTDCTGPFGLTTSTATRRPRSAPSPRASSTCSSRAPPATSCADGLPVTFSANADVTFAAATPAALGVVWTGNWTRTDEHDEVLTHASDLEIAVDLSANCRTASGSAMTEVASRSVDTSLGDYKVCRDTTTGEEGCPSGSVVHTADPSGRVISMSFDDSAVAEVTGPRGDTYAVSLECTSIGR